MTSRERNLALIVAGVGLVAVAAFGGTSYLERRGALNDQIESAEKQRDEDEDVLDRKQRMARELDRMRKNGLQPNAAYAEQHLQVAGTQWRTQAGVTFVGTDAGSKPKAEGGFDRLEQKMAVTGKQAQLAKLLWEIETTDLPVRVNGLSVTAREGQDFLTAQVTIVALAEQQPASKAPGRTK